MKPTYGVGYEPLGSLADFVDPFGIRNIPGNIKKKVDGYVDQKAQRAAALAEQHVEAGVNRAINTAQNRAIMFAAGGLLVGAVWGGVTLYRRSKERR